MPRREPQNIEAEISVLGCGFLEKNALDKINANPTATVFNKLLLVFDLFIVTPLLKRYI